MTRLLFLSLLMVGLVSISASCADVEIAPPPREIRPDGTRDPAPTPAVEKAPNPLETVERIIKNSKSVSDKLAMSDIGTETRKTQGVILKDIQSLIDQQENPPSSNSNQNQDMDKDKKPNDMNDMKNDMPMNDKSNQKKDMPGNGGTDQGPKGDGSDKQKGRQPRQQPGDQPKGKGGDPMNQSENSNAGKEKSNGGSKKPGPSSQNANAGTIPKEPKKGKDPPTTPSIPPEENMNKNVWGYLPDKLRQQAMQYYKQEFMPRYEKLLEHYYSSLDDKKNKK